MYFVQKLILGAAYNQKCYCWDEHARMSGGDPLTSETMCDSSCGLGECALKSKCGSAPPPPYSPPEPAYPDPVAAEAKFASEVSNTQYRAEQNGN